MIRVLLLCVLASCSAFFTPRAARWPARALARRRITEIDASEDYYAILGIEQSASESDIRAAYKQLSRVYHPDLRRDLLADASMKTSLAAACGLRHVFVDWRFSSYLTDKSANLFDRLFDQVAAAVAVAVAVCLRWQTRSQSRWRWWS